MGIKLNWKRIFRSLPSITRSEIVFSRIQSGNFHAANWLSNKFLARVNLAGFSAPVPLTLVDGQGRPRSLLRPWRKGLVPPNLLIYFPNINCWKKLSIPTSSDYSGPAHLPVVPFILSSNSQSLDLWGSNHSTKKTFQVPTMHVTENYSIILWITSRAMVEWTKARFVIKFFIPTPKHSPLWYGVECISVDRHDPDKSIGFPFCTLLIILFVGM